MAEVSRIEALNEINAKVLAGNVCIGTLEQLVYGLVAELQMRIHADDALTAENARLRGACQSAIHHGLDDGHGFSLSQERKADAVLQQLKSALGTAVEGGGG